MPEFDSTIEYRDVVGFPGYKVGSDGSVWSCWRPVGHGNGGGGHFAMADHWRQLRPKRTNKWGHLSVYLKGGIYRLVHHLVLEAFAGPCPPGMEGCHFPDRSPWNNQANNLRWATSAENKADMIAHGTSLRGHRNPRAKLTEELVRKIRAEYVRGVFGHIRLGKKYGVSEGTIRRALSGACWGHVEH